MGDPISILCLGDPAKQEPSMKAALEKCNCTWLPLNQDGLLKAIAPPPRLILCCYSSEGLRPAEVAQGLKMIYPDTPAFLVGSASDGCDRPLLIKNGFSEVFFLPFDQHLLVESIALTLHPDSSFRSVRLLDLGASTTLDFDTFLFMPLNLKHIRYSNAGEQMQKERIDRLQKHQVSSIFVSLSQLPKFYDYTAKRLRAAATEPMSATERRQRTQATVRAILSGLFVSGSTSTSSGKQVVEDCRKIVAAFVSQSPVGSIYTKILQLTADSSNAYSHSANVSAFAALFSLATSVGNPEELALAGLLHDIGLARVPTSVLDKAPADWTMEDRSAYERHPEHAVDIIRDRKLVLPPSVLKAILQHHENFGGEEGYPSGVNGSRICPEARVLAVADAFDELTSSAPGKEKLSIEQALARLHANRGGAEGETPYDPEIVEKIEALMNPEASPSISA